MNDYKQGLMDGWHGDEYLAPYHEPMDDDFYEDYDDFEDDK